MTLIKKNIRTNAAAHSKKAPAVPYCVGSSPDFDPTRAFSDKETREEALKLLNESDDFEGAIRRWFGIPLGGDDDEYVYHAVASVTLGQVQRAVEFGKVKGKKAALCRWYDAEDDTKGEEDGGGNLSNPSEADITAYTNIFLPCNSAPAALKGFGANAKKGSVREKVASYLGGKRYHATPEVAERFKVPKCKKEAAPVANPYLDFWVWSCRAVGWCGPVPEQKLRGHHLLPVLMHHFGCAVPSHEAMSIIKILAGKDNKKTVLDIGSGNGYWSWMLRNGYGVETVAVDNGQSEWRVNYLPAETVCLAGTDYLASLKSHDDTIMMLVYPVVGGTVSGTVEGSFTRDLMAAYKGNTVVIVGTQNHNGYTAFKNMTFDEYMDKEQKQNGWVKLLQVPLPSFAGKDEAMYVYQREQATSK